LGRTACNTQGEGRVKKNWAYPRAVGEALPPSRVSAAHVCSEKPRGEEGAEKKDTRGRRRDWRSENPLNREKREEVGGLSPLRERKTRAREAKRKETRAKATPPGRRMKKRKVWSPRRERGNVQADAKPTGNNFFGRGCLRRRSDGPVEKRRRP